MEEREEVCNLDELNVEEMTLFHQFLMKLRLKRVATVEKVFKKDSKPNKKVISLTGFVFSAIFINDHTINFAQQPVRAKIHLPLRCVGLLNL